MRNEKLTIFIGAEKLRLVRRFKTAITEFQRILEFDPEDAAIMEKIGDVYIEWDKKAEGLQEYQKSIEHYQKKEEREKALKCLDKIIQLDNDNSMGYKEEAETRITGIEKEIEEAAKLLKLEEEKARADELKKEAQKDFATIGSPLFEDCSPEELSEVVKITNVVELAEGDILFRQGDAGDSLYIIDSGVMEVVVSRSKKKSASDDALHQELEETETPLVQLERGDFFGEISFLSGSNRTATLVAKENTRLFEISREDFRKVLEVIPQMEKRLLDYYKDRVLDLILAKSDLFSFLNKEQRYEVREYFELVKYDKDDVIIEENSTERSLFLIKYGTVQVITTNPAGKKIVLTKLHAHSFFGEVSFLTGNKRTANVVALIPTELLVFSYENLTKLVEKYPRIKEILQSFQKKRAFQTIKKFKLV